MHKLLPVLNVLGLIVILFTATMAGPLAVSLYLQDGAQDAFVQSLGASFAAGLLLFAATRARRRELGSGDGFLLATLVWAVLAAVGALPLLFYFHGAGMPLSFTDAYFEGMTALTTTGATILTGLDALPPSINIWRCTLVWIGGMGILILVVAVLPMLGAGGSQVFRAEVPGPMKEEKLTPRIANTAKGLYGLYMAVSILCLLGYRMVGLDWYDAYCMMATTVSLGGIPYRDAGFMAIDSIGVEIIALIFMVIAGISFAVHFQALRRRSLRAYFTSTETKAYLATLAVSVAIVTAVLIAHGVYGSGWTAFRYALFNAVSMATTAGYANADFSQWPLFAPMFMILVSSFASTAGSTGGGIKMIRLVILVKQARREFVHILHPHVINPILVSGATVPNRVVFSVLAFILLYLAALLTLTMALLLTGMDPVTAFTAVMACLNSLGTGLGDVGPPAGSFATLTDPQAWICAFAMLIGRLEMFAVLILFTRAFWRK